MVARQRPRQDGKALTYADLLRREGLRVRRQHPWAHVGEAARRQGWKLHVSSIPTEAPLVLRRILPALKAAGVPFKVIGDVELLSQLNEGSFGATQVGKFATIYPPSDAAARRLATALVELTRGCHGPVVATDLKVGDIIYARYGAFTPVFVRDRLGRHASYVVGPDRRLQRDDYKIPFVLPPGRKNPFAGMVERGPGSQARTVGHDGALFGPGFRLLEVLKADPKGNVYRGLDLRDQRRIAIWVLKEGRQWCLADGYGRDMRSRLKHQALLHQALAGRAPVPEAGDYFEVDGHGYLPVAYLRGRTLVQMAGDDRQTRTWSALRIGRKRDLLKGLLGAVSAVSQLHRAGYIHRDLSGGNVLVQHGGSVVLLDLELAHKVGDPTPPFGLGTPGFMSPDQEARKPPTPADDVYAIGALALLLVTGIDPRRLTFAAPPDRLDQWESLAAGVDRRLLELIVRCVDPRAPRRPSLAQLRRALDDAVAALRAAGGPAYVPRAAVPAREAGRRVRHSMRGLLTQTLIDRESGLWLSDAFDTHEADGQRRGRHELRRSANRGVAGVLYVLGRLARCGYRTSAGDAGARRAARWLLGGSPAPDSGLPGLHFGDAGVGVALVEAIAGELIAETSATTRFLRRALSGALDWPDLTHGAAGQGIAALYCADRLADPSFAALAGRCARYLIETQHRAGHWTWPSAPRGSRDVYTGFAHGVAGITYFLADYARRTGEAAAERSWRRGAAWLIARAEARGRVLTWPNSTGQTERWAWWCHGSIGIAVLFLRLFEQTGEPQFADIARRALGVHPPEFLPVNLSQCHGLCGVGEVYIEAARVLGDRRWQRRADAVAGTLWNLRRDASGRGATWIVETPYTSTADLMVGCGGVVHFFLRAQTGTIGLPLLLDPLQCG